MAEPVIAASKTRWGTIPLIPADLTEPDNTHKDQGWQSAEEPSHSFTNYWMNVVYLWLVYLDGLPAEAMTWTAAHIFQAGITVTRATAGTAVVATGNGTGRGIVATGGDTNGIGGLFTGGAGNGIGVSAFATGTANAIEGTASGTAGSVGMRAVGSSDEALKATTGSSTKAAIYGSGPLRGGEFEGAGTGGGAIAPGKGMKAIGGAQVGTLAGAVAGEFIGGAQSGTTSNAGAGLTSVGGAVAGGTNATGIGGAGGVFTGGDITADVNGRRGGSGIKVSGGVGQGGTGHAIEVVTGELYMGANIITQTGGVNVLSATEFLAGIDVDGSANIDVNLSVTGTATVNGVATLASVAVEAVIAPTLVNGWANMGGAEQTAGYWKDALGYVWMRGLLNTAPATAATITTLPGGYRPSKKETFNAIHYATGQAYSITVTAAGVVDYTGPVGGTAISLSAVRFRI